MKTTAQSDGLVSLTLTKDWGRHKAGNVLRVDPQRARQLKADGFLAEPNEPAKQRRATRRGRGEE